VQPSPLSSGLSCSAASWTSPLKSPSPPYYGGEPHWRWLPVGTGLSMISVNSPQL
jgi:hypothetical protein